MSYVIAGTDVLASVAADVAGIGSSLTADNSVAAARTTAVVAAAEDEVSAAIASLFSGHAQAFQTLSAQAAAFHNQFVQTLNNAGSAYAVAEAANASPLAAAVSAAQTLDVFSPIAAATGRPLVGNSTIGAAASPNNGSTAAGTPINATVPLHQVGITLGNTGSIQEQVDISVNGGRTSSVVLDTGSAGLLIPITDVGLRHLGMPTGFGHVTYGEPGSGNFRTDYYATFHTTVNFGNGIVTAPTSVDVPIVTVESITLSLAHPIDIPLPSPLSPIVISHLPTLTWAFPDVPPFTHFGQSGVGILGIGPNALGPGSSPVTAALPGDLNEGVLINAQPGGDPTAGYLEFGPAPSNFTPIASVAGSPLTTVEVSVNGGTPETVSTAIDSGGQYGAIPASLVGDDTVTRTLFGFLSTGQTVPAGTTISVYTTNGQELYTYTTTAGTGPQVTSEGLATTAAFNTGASPFLIGPVYISNSPSGGTTTFGQLS